MSKFSLKKVYYNSNILNEMAIITQSNFIDRIINIVKSKPKVAGGYYNSFEELQESLQNASLDDKEDTLIEEILKCVNHTNLLSLTGKENKKARKQAEVLIIKQLRKYKCIDGESIDFKGVLPLFDKIAEYLEQKGDVSFDDCIMAADLYMRRFYNLANEEEKKEISKGNFDFSIIFNKTKFYSDYIKTKTNVNSQEDIIKVFEDENIKVVYPKTPQAFNKAIILSGINLDEIDWCTRRANTWYNYTSQKYVAIAINKKSLDTYDPDYLFSLKVRFDGTIDANDTCDRDNEHCNQDIIDEYFSDEAKEAISKLPSLTNATVTNLKSAIKGFSDLNDIDSLIEIFVQVLSTQRPDEALNYFVEFCRTDGVSSDIERSQVGKIIAESISFYMFDCPNAESYEYSDLVNVKSYYPIDEVLKYFKEVITKNGSHARYLDTLLKLNPISLDALLEFDDVCNALRSSLNTTNTNNFKRLIDTFLTNTNVNYYLNPKSISNKNAGLTTKNKEIYNIIYKSKAMQTYIKENSVDTVKHANPNRVHTFESFIALLALRQPDDLVEKINQYNPESPVTLKDVDKKLISSYLLEDFGYFGEKSIGNDKSKKFLALSIEEYIKIREELFSNTDTLQNILKDSDIDFRKSLISYILKCLHEGSKNPLGLKKDDNTLKSLDILFSYDDYDLDFVISKLTFRFPFSFLDFSDKSLQNISDKLLSDESLRTNLEIYTRILGYNRSELASQNLMALLSYQETNNKIKIVLLISNKMWSMVEEVSSISEFLNKVLDASFEDTETQQLINYITAPHDPMLGHGILDYLMPAAICSCKNISDDIKMNAFLKIIKTSYSMRVHRMAHVSKLEEVIAQCIYSIDDEIIDVQSVIEEITSNKKTLLAAVERFLMIKSGLAIISKIIITADSKNIVIPKTLLSNLLLNSNHSNGIQPYKEIVEMMFSNFINKSFDGNNFLQGHDLSLVRNTLLSLFKKPNGGYFSKNEYKKIAMDCVKKLNPSARKQMALVFPEIKDELFSWTEDEQKEIKADSLIRQYVNMLLS